MRPLGGLRRWLGPLLIANSVVAVTAGVFDVWEEALLDRPVHEISGDTLRRADDAVVTMGLLQLLLFVGTAVVFVVWFHRAYGNAHHLAAQQMPGGRWWAVFGWVLPFANLIIPYRIADVTWRSAAAAPGQRWKDAKRSRVVIWWWVTFLVAGLAAVGSRGSFTDVTDLEDLRDSMSTLVVADILLLVTALTAYRFVVRLSELHDDRRKQAESPAAT